MAAPTTTYRMWKRLAERPGGTRLFSAAAMVRVPYFASIMPHVERMEPGFAEVTVPKWFFVKGVQSSARFIDTSYGMGALSVALHEEQASGASGGAATGAAFIQAGSMTMGRTATTTTPPAAPETSVAVPPVKAPPYGGGGLDRPVILVGWRADCHPSQRGVEVVTDRRIVCGRGRGPRRAFHLSRGANCRETPVNYVVKPDTSTAPKVFAAAEKP